MKTSRRNFLKRASCVVAALAVCPMALMPKEEIPLTIDWSKTILLSDQLDPDNNGLWQVRTRQQRCMIGGKKCTITSIIEMHKLNQKQNGIWTTQKGK